nr:MAG TPA: hypothetical protein [Caudoviricetes sp.]
MLVFNEIIFHILICFYELASAAIYLLCDMV